MTTSRLLAAGAAALATTAVLATAGSAAPKHHTLHFTSKSQTGVGFFPDGAPTRAASSASATRSRAATTGPTAPCAR